MHFTNRRVARFASLAVAAAAIAVPLASTTAAHAVTAPVLTPSVSDSLSNGQHITVSGTGFPASSSLTLAECSSVPTDEASALTDCNVGGAVQVNTDASGNFTNVPFTIVAGQVGNGFCPTKAAENTCVLITGNQADPSNTAYQSAAPIKFLPVVSVSPSTNVKNGSQITVTGYGFPPSQNPAYIVECGNSFPPSQATCNPAPAVSSTNANGILAAAKLTVSTGTWGGKSCKAGGNCLVTATTDINPDPAPDTAGFATFTFAKAISNLKTSVLAAAKVKHGKVKITGAVTSKGSGVKGLKAVLYDRKKGTTKWHKVSGATTKAHGVFSFSTKHQSHKEQYQVKHPKQKVGSNVYLASAGKTLTVK